MKEECDYIKDLLERFFEGETSNTEEQELYHFFRLDNIPEELAQYKPVLMYFESGFAHEIENIRQTDELPEFLISTKNVIQHPASKVESSQRKLWITWGGVAASFLIIISASLFLLTAKEPFDSYAGSYIIRNGVRITDLNLIMPELEAAVQKSLILEQEMEQQYEVQLKQQLNEHNNQILKNIKDENIRKEVEEIIFTQL